MPGRRCRLFSRRYENKKKGRSRFMIYRRSTSQLSARARASGSNCVFIQMCAICISEPDYSITDAARAVPGTNLESALKIPESRAWNSRGGQHEFYEKDDPASRSSISIASTAIDASTIYLSVEVSLSIRYQRLTDGLSNIPRTVETRMSFLSISLLGDIQLYPAKFSIEPKRGY